MNLFATVLERVRNAAERLAGEGALASGVDLSRITAEPLHDPALGDITTNAALVLADGLGRPPRDLAPPLAAALADDPLVIGTEVGGPGFLNFTLRADAWTQALRHLLTEPAIIDPTDQDISFDIKPLQRSDNLDREADFALRAIAAFWPSAAPPPSAADLTEQAYRNPLFSVQYGHARARAVYRHARESFPDLPDAPERRLALWRDAALERLDDTSERALIRVLAAYRHALETAAAQRQPHRLGTYLHRLAGTFHAQLRHGMVTPYLRFISLDDRQLTVARLALVEAVVIILGAGLSQLGFEAPDEIT